MHIVGKWLGVTCCGLIGHLEARAAVEPNPVVCQQRTGNDFGPPEDCSDQLQEHTRNVVATSVANSTVSSTSTVIFVTDLDGYQLAEPLAPLAADAAPSRRLASFSTRWQPTPYYGPQLTGYVYRLREPHPDASSG